MRRSNAVIMVLAAGCLSACGQYNYWSQTEPEDVLDRRLPALQPDGPSMSAADMTSRFGPPDFSFEGGRLIAYDLVLLRGEPTLFGDATQEWLDERPLVAAREYEARGPYDRPVARYGLIARVGSDGRIERVRLTRVEP